MTHLNSEARRYIRAYRPLLPTERWEPIQKFVIDAIEASGETSRHRIRLRMSVLSRFADWANLLHLGAIDLSLLDERIIDAYFEHRKTENSPATAERQRNMLRIMAGLANETEIARDSTIAAPTPPYTVDEQWDLYRKVDGMPHGKTRESLLRALALGFGCGLTSFELASIRAEHVEPREHGVDVHIQGRRPRTVTAAGEWEDLLLNVESSSEFLIYPARRRKVETAHIGNFPIPNLRKSFTATRMRVTWILGLLQARLPLDLIIDSAGLDSPYSLIRILEFVEPVGEAERALLLRTGGML